MSTQKKIIDATMFTRQGIYDGIDYSNELCEIRWKLDLYLLKKSRPITGDMLSKNGFEILTPRVTLPFKTWRLKDHPDFWIDEYEEDFVDSDSSVDEINKGSFILHLTSTCVKLKTAADLELALDLYGVDKDIEIWH